jgi:hypothetical protein
LCLSAWFKSGLVHTSDIVDASKLPPAEAQDGSGSGKKVIDTIEIA